MPIKYSLPLFSDDLKIDPHRFISLHSKHFYTGDKHTCIYCGKDWIPCATVEEMNDHTKKFHPEKLINQKG
jgi:hypothetical protein